MTQPRTKTSTPRLSDLARHVVAPSGVVSTGWPAVEAKCAELGVTFRPWQALVGRLILAKRASGTYAATIGGMGMSIPRQVGKTFLVAAIVFALCLLRPGLTVIWTAHRLRTAEETFGKMQAFAKRRKIKPHVAKLVLGSGEEEVRFVNGSRILFGARERGFGRGFDEVDVLIFDEAQILSDSALDDMVPATNQSRQETSALLLFMGTPPKPTDPGEVFTRMRTEALSGEDEDTGWVEFGADPSYRPPKLPEPLVDADWRQVAKANPSYPQDTPREAILRMRKKLGDESYLREGMGIWTDAHGSGVIDMAKWGALLDHEPRKPGSPVFGLAVSKDQTVASIYVVGAGAGNVPLIAPVDERRGTGWVAERLAELCENEGAHAAIDKGGPAASVLRDLADRNVPLIELTQGEYAQACGALLNDVNNEAVRHVGDPVLDEAVRTAKTRTLGERWAWARGTADIVSLEAATVALHGYRTQPSTEAWGFFE